ncbi:MAG: ATP-binding protein [Deltaproteobacteria bacterium]
MVNFKSIRSRILSSFLLLIVLTVAILDCLILFFVQQYYIINVEEILSNQIQVVSNFNADYLSDLDLNQDSRRLVDSFADFTSAEIQIFNLNGKLIADSNSSSIAESGTNTDVKAALSGKLGKWRGVLPKSSEPVMSIAYPLKANKKIIGVVRFITSLKDIKEITKNVGIILISIGLFVILFVAILSIFISSTISKPIHEITIAAQEMAAGNLSKKIPKLYDDEVGKLTDTLNYMSSEMLKQDRLKNEFISSISHEIRTPLTSIKGWIVTLLSGDLKNQEEQKEGLEIIDREADRLTLLVEELLDFSKFEAGKITLNISSVNIGELMEYIAKQMTPRAKRQNIELKADINSKAVNLTLDENRMKQVLINLLDNCLKFTPPGGQIKLANVYSKESVKIIVEDTGWGIRQEDLPKVKQRFYKANTASAGSGLGLAICEEIVKLHGGTLEIESHQENGTKVEITLPMIT